MLHAVHNDTIIWQSFKAGDRTSFEKIYQLYFKNLYEYGMRLLNNSDLVKDNIHDLFVKIWMNKSNLGEVTNVKSYLLVSLRGAIYNNNAKNKKPAISIEELDEGYYFKMDFSVENEFIRKDNFSDEKQKLLALMNSLSPRQKEVIYLKYFEELSYDEIASIMHISVKATYKLSARALDSLRQILNVSNVSLFILIALGRLPSLS